MKIELGREVGEYRVESLVRTGSGGDVYRAEQPELRRSVTLHFPAASAGSESTERFLEVARLLAGLDHPNLLPVYEVGEADNRPYAAVRDASGPRLNELLEAGPLPPAQAVAIGEQVAAALEALQAAGATPAALTTSSVVVAGESGSEQVYVSPLEAVVETPLEAPVQRDTGADSDPAVAALGRLLTTMVTGSDAEVPAARERLPEELRPVIERALAPEQSYPSPSALMTAARQAIEPTEIVSRPLLLRRPGLAALAILAAAAVAVLAVVLVVGRDDAGTGRRASSNALAGRLAATIPLQATPGSVAVGEDAIWVATAEGTVLRVDPERNQVVGAPVRFMEARQGENVTVRVGEGAVWVLDGTGGTLTRIDPESARVTGRLRIGGILHGATVGEGSIWISRAPPGAAARQGGELVRVDARRFARAGRPIPIGSGAFDVELEKESVWTMNAGDGTVTRVDIRTHRTRTFLAGAVPVNAAVHQGTLWIPDPVNGTVTPVNTRELRPPEIVIRQGHPLAATSTAGAIWVSSETPGGPTRVYRIDPRARSIAGRPVDVGTEVGWISGGLGAVWVPSTSKRALLKIVPTSPAPSPGATPMAAEPGRLVSGPLSPGRWRADRFAVPFSVSLGDRGWISLAPETQLVNFGRFYEPRRQVAVIAPTQVFAANGSVRRLANVGQLVAALKSNPNVRIIEEDRVRLGGRAALRLTVRARPHTGYPDFCRAPCVALFPLPQNTWAVESSANQRLTILSVAGRIVVAAESGPLQERGFSQTGSLLNTLRFAAAG